MYMHCALYELKECYYLSCRRLWRLRQRVSKSFMATLLIEFTFFCVAIPHLHFFSQNRNEAYCTFYIFCLKLSNPKYISSLSVPKKVDFNASLHCIQIFTKVSVTYGSLRGRIYQTFRRQTSNYQYMCLWWVSELFSMIYTLSSKCNNISTTFHQKYCKTAYARSGVNQMQILKNS